MEMPKQINQIQIKIQNIENFYTEILNFLQARWAQIVSAQFVNNSWPLKLITRHQGIVLIVGTSHNAWNNEIEWIKEKILQEINKPLAIINFNIVDINYETIGLDRLSKMAKTGEIDSKISLKNEKQEELKIDVEVQNRINRIQDTDLQKSLLKIAKYLK